MLRAAADAREREPLIAAAHWTKTGYKEEALEEGAAGSDSSVVFYLLKCIMGAGGFAIPWAFARMGLVVGTVSMCACAVASCFTLHQLSVLRVQVRAKLGQRCSTYVDLAQATLGEHGARVVYCLVVVCSLGVCSAYLVFIASALCSMQIPMTSGAVALATATVLLPVVCLGRGLSALTVLAQAGTVAVLLGYAVTICYALMGQGVGAASSQGRPAEAVVLPSLLAPADWASAVAGFGPIAFLFLIHFLSVPVMASSSSGASAQQGRFERLVLVAFGIAAAVNGCFGALCLVYFQGQVSSIVINDIAAGTWWLSATKLLLCADLLCSYPIAFAAGCQVVEASLEPRVQVWCLPEVGGGSKTSAADPWRCAVRTGLLLVTVGVAQLHDFGTIISLVGGFAQVTMAFVLPPLMLLRLEGPSMSRLHWCANGALALLGSCLALLVTGTSLASAVRGHAA